MTAHIGPDFAAGWQSADARAAGYIIDIEGALKTIAGHRDDGPWMVTYREAGGGYEGLQAVAEAALARLDEFREVAPLAFDTQGQK